jgi:hypothetical protein
MMNLSIFGSSEIIYHHIIAAKKNSFKIFSICTSNKKSKNIKKIAKKFNIKRVYFDWKEFIKASQKNKCSILIAGRIKDNKKILEYCLKLKLKILIEKPVFTKIREFNKFLKYKNEIFVGYNRIYYRNILSIKKKINSKLLSVFIKCPETNKKSIKVNTCHIISILYYLFGNLFLVKKVKNKNSIICIFKNKKKIPIIIYINLKSPDNFSIEFNFQNKRLLLRPIEKLHIYNKLIIKKNLSQKIYQPNILRTISENKFSKEKAGFDLQYSNFKNLIKNKKNFFLNIIDAKKIMSICEKIAN